MDATTSPGGTSPGDDFDYRRRYVRIRSERKGFIEFDFAVGWPELSVELLMPREAFESFCARNDVRFLEPATDEAG